MRKIFSVLLISIMTLWCTCFAYAETDIYTPTTGVITTAVEKPDSIKSETVDFKKIKLTWEPVLSASGYEIFRSLGNGKDEKIAVIGDSNTTTYYDTKSLKASSKPYFYTIRAFYKLSDTEYLYSHLAFDDYGTKASVGTAQFTEHRALVKKSNNKQLSGIKLSWDKVAKADGYEIYYMDEDGDAPFKKLTTVKGKTTYTVKTSKLKKDHAYTFRIRAYRVIDGKKYFGDYSYDMSDEDIVVYSVPISTSAPKNVRIEHSEEGTYLKWNKVKGVERYGLYIKNSSNGEWKYERDISGNSYKLTGYSNKPVYFSLSSGKLTSNWHWIFSSKKSNTASLNVEYDEIVKFNSPYVEKYIRDILNKPTGELKLWQIMENDFMYTGKKDNLFPLGISSQEIDDVISDLNKIKLYGFSAYGVYSDLQNSEYGENKEHIEYFKSVHSEVSKIINNNIHDNMSDYDKAKVLHDYLVNNMSYSYEIKNNGSTNPHVYDALILDTGVCHDYSAAYELLCEKAGLECDEIQSETHAWNIVKIDGEWYNVDCTWDDPVGGSLRYEYFLISDDRIESIGQPDHARTDHYKENYPACSENYR